MKYVLYVLLAIGGLLGLSNVLAIFGQGNITGLGLAQGLFVLVGSLLLLLSIYGYAKNTSWKKNIVYLGLGLTFVSGLISLLSVPIWIIQLGLPIIALVVLLILK